MNRLKKIASFFVLCVFFCSCNRSDNKELIVIHPLLRKSTDNKCKRDYIFIEDQLQKKKGFIHSGLLLAMAEGVSYGHIIFSRWQNKAALKEAKKELVLPKDIGEFSTQRQAYHQIYKLKGKDNHLTPKVYEIIFIKAKRENMRKDLSFTINRLIDHYQQSPGFIEAINYESADKNQSDYDYAIINKWDTLDNMSKSREGDVYANKVISDISDTYDTFFNYYELYKK